MCLLFIGACHFHWDEGAPSLDWDEFDPGHIDKTLSKKSPLGDYSVIFWQYTKGSYTRQKLANYVVGHHWMLVDSEKLDSASARLYEGIVVGIVNTLFNPVNKNHPPTDWFKSGVILYKFGFMRSSDKKAPPKWFHSEVLVSPDESKMSVYPIMDDS
jgi:hypothetical protein